MGKNLKGRELGKGISQRPDGRYMVRISANGQRKTQYFDTLDLARAAARKNQMDKVYGKLGIRPKMTVDDWFKQWMSAYKVSNSYKTKQRDNDLYRIHIAPKIGRMQLANVKPIDCQAILAECADKGYSKAWGVTVRRFLNDMFQTADDNDLIDKNPINRSVTASGKKPKTNLILTAAQQQIFERLCDNSVFGNAYRFALHTGMRYGEFSGLKLSDIETLPNGRKQAHIERSIAWRDDLQIFAEKPPKTAKSRRIVPLDDVAAEMIERQMLANQQLQIVPPYQDYIFLNGSGKPAEPSNYDRALTSLRNQMPNLTTEQREQKFSLHTLRHTFATRCAEAGLQPKYLQEIMGHEDISTTLKFYTHVTADMRESEFNKLLDYQAKTGVKSLTVG